MSIENDNDRDQALCEDLVFAIAAPIGTDADAFERAASDCARMFKYEPISIEVADYFEWFEASNACLKPTGTPDERLHGKISAGNALVAALDNRAALATLAVSRIVIKHRGNNGRRLFIIRSIKRFEELTLLRSVYGSNFFMVGLLASEAHRADVLASVRGLENPESIIKRDAKEKIGDDTGQDMLNVFQHADVFVPMEDVCAATQRFFDVIMGHPHITPTPDESGMFHAFSASLNSHDLSRQVGAAIVSRNGDLLSIGTNDVPRLGQGLLSRERWPSKTDFERGFDANDKEKAEIFEAAAEQIAAALGDQNIKKEKVRVVLASSELKRITEFQRAVHAEMDAILACVRSGQDPRGGTVYTTTFPCHNCARHIAGIGAARVLFIEPYPKSAALTLHGDVLELDPTGSHSNVASIAFEQFAGVGPRRLGELFSLQSRTLREWSCPGFVEPPDKMDLRHQEKFDGIGSVAKIGGSQR